LTIELRRYVKDKVLTGRYQDENEVVGDAIRQMQQREFEQFERLFGDYPGAPQGEPTDSNTGLFARPHLSGFKVHLALMLLLLTWFHRCVVQLPECCWLGFCLA
jgi:hypothetical protein